MGFTLIHNQSKINDESINYLTHNESFLKWDSEIIYLRHKPQSNIFTSNLHLFLIDYSRKELIFEKNKIIFQPLLNKILEGSNIKELLFIDNLTLYLDDSFTIESNNFQIKLNSIVFDKLREVLVNGIPL